MKQQSNIPNLHGYYGPKPGMSPVEFFLEVQKLTGNYCDPATVLAALKRIVAFNNDLRHSEVATMQHWDGKPYNWFPQLEGYYFIIVDKFPTKDNRQLQLHLGSVSTNYSSPEQAKKDFESIYAKYSDYDWTGSNPRIVKSPCAFDAGRKGTILIELLKYEQKGE